MATMADDPHYDDSEGEEEADGDKPDLVADVGGIQKKAATRRSGETQLQLGSQRPRSQIKIWRASLLRWLVAPTIILCFHGYFGISRNPILDPSIAPKLLFDHSRYQYHPPEPRNWSSESVGIGPDPECGRGPYFDQYFQKRGQRSVNNEDKTIYDKLFLHTYSQQDPQKRHTYIELGAFDGLTESNTRFFDICLNWDGILIEGNPAKFPSLLKNRPHAHRLNFAPGCSTNSTNETIPFHAVVFTNGGLAGFAKDYPEGYNIVQVPCGSLTPVLQELAPNGIDFFSLDVEGSEPLIVGNIEFGKVYIHVLMIESWNNHCPREPNKCETRIKTREIMQKAGYHRFSNIIQKSDLYVHPESPYLTLLPSDQYQMHA
ncbi:hypothetical protein ACHAXA_008746 [Cyclostephanos tholiformis]|uniref:Methyltransferase FkbM domain-containing protein n=1 Tax=Cyclostephanos tholiformis TaxID=382380 RepID=A0ABD3REQ0_9STRA